VFKVVVWATDGSRSADDALALATGLAKSSGAKLHVVHVDELVPGRAGGSHRSVLEEDIERDLGLKVKELKDEGIDATLETPKIVEGGVAHAIADLARDTGADIIVVGTRGLGPVAGLLLGSVTHRLLHIAPCPVLTVPSSDRQRTSIV
jgi:nucleotide-binding universal stress UspA family protein